MQGEAIGSQSTISVREIRNDGKLDLKIHK